MAGKLAGKTAIVTGASRGIGEAIARLFAVEGASVVCGARTLSDGQHFLPGTLEHTVKQITEAGGKAVAVKVDLSREEDCQQIVDAARKAYGPVDILVNNAAVNWYIPIKDFKLSHWKAMLAVDLTAPFLLAQMVIPEMIARGGGYIVNISSGASRGPGVGPYSTAGRGGTPYGTVKSGLERFTQGLAHELFANHIAVNSLAPNKVVPTPGTIHHHLVTSMDDPRGEPVEYMAQATLLLATCDPAQVTGRVAYSQDILKEFGWLK
ncbi:MAG: SDR family NAD(P)-dependent oxidoreductase [Chloroflexi bacterium]|nr:SDR family NAD(P)-dependent oxidoreductase [Chloroflexota bacterium]